MKMKIGKNGSVITVDDRGVDRMKAQGWQEVKEVKAKKQPTSKKVK
jgi:hypothetical protein